MNEMIYYTIILEQLVLYIYTKPYLLNKLLKGLHVLNIIMFSKDLPTKPKLWY